MAAANSQQTKMIKVGVAVVALIVAVALPAWYFLGGNSTTPTPSNNMPAAPTPEEQQQIEEYRQRPPVPTEEGSA